MKFGLKKISPTCLVVSVLSFQVAFVWSSQHERQLYNQLLQGYNKLVRPVRHAGDAVRVRLRFSLVDILSVDENNGHISIKAWLAMNWKDEYLTWNPDLHGGIKRLNFPTDGNNRIWTPDITMFNALKTELDSNIQAVVSADGLVTWIQPAVYAVRCRHEFRGNSWVSVFKIGSWTYSEQMLDIKPPPPSASNGGDPSSTSKEVVDIDTDNYTTNDHWAMLEHSGRRDVVAPQLQGCCDRQSFVSLHYVLKLRKKLGPSLLGRR